MGERTEKLVAFRKNGGQNKRACGAVRRAEWHDLDAKRKNWNAAAQWNADRPAQRSRDMRPLPCETRAVFGKMGSGTIAFQYASGLAHVSQSGLRRRTDARHRGALQLFTIPAEQDVCIGRDLQRLSRSPQRCTASAGGWRLPAVPHAGQV